MNVKKTVNYIAVPLLAMIFMGIAVSPAEAQSYEKSSLKGLSAVYVLVEDLPPGAKVLGLNVDAIQTDVELKLRLAGMRVVTKEEAFKLPGAPDLYVAVNLTNDAQAASIDIELDQDAILDRNSEPADNVTTWTSRRVIARPSAQVIRDMVKDHVDIFLNDWLAVNPKK